MLAATGQASKGAWRRRCRRCDGLDRLARSTRDRRQACVARVPTAGEHSEHRRNPLRGGGRAYETEVRLLKPRRRGWDRRALRAGCRVVDRAVPSRQLNPRNRTHRPAGVASALGRVEMWRGGCRSNISVAAPFVWRCLSGSTVAPFPHPAHRTGQADLPHPALGQNFTPSPTARRARARSSVRAHSARKGARVDKSRPCVA